MITFIIPTYKHKEQLYKNLTHNKQFFKHYKVIIGNDNPQDVISVTDILDNAVVINGKINKGFAGNMNECIKEATTQYLIFLNDDVLLHDTSYEEGLKHFEDNSKLFAVSFAQKEKTGAIVGANRIFWQKGFLQHTAVEAKDVIENGWAEGGACMVNTDILRKLNGFDIRYNPFYWEDIDLSLRAKKLGFSILFDPNIIVEHHHESTIGNLFSKQKITEIAFRNQLLCTWSNIPSAFTWILHICTLIFFLVKELMKGNIFYIHATIEALKKIATKRT
jgi:GT2 family glycosyltransferase